MAVCLGSGKYKINIGGLSLAVKCPGVLPQNILLSLDGHIMLSSDAFYLTAKEV